MIEQELYQYMQDNITTTDNIYWGKMGREVDPKKGDIVVLFFKTPSLSSQITPSYLDVFQISVFAEYIDAASITAREIMELFHLNNFTTSNYKCWVNNIINQGSLIDEDDIVQIPLQLEIKYSGL